ncbi:Uncharacterized protein TCAP_04020 [Tolypocladium capitatum]|uniref:Uncharacterized protein n=1 Tax=Tolypocladium capitatum TaxID=45235 RepID=A0A2K3QET3_9HYPO|nr:Uncharacterized protein TCAP_04020 [Tolypocladium capitatum]
MADSSMSYVYTIGGYATLIGVGYALYHVSTQKGNRRGAAPVSRSAKTAHQEPRKEDKKKKQRMESFASEAQEASKAGARVKASDEAHPTVSRNAADDTSDDGVDNREFARQFAKAKEGAKLASKADGLRQREKSVKQSRANQTTKPIDDLPEDKASGPSSTTGADADDDQSPLLSPETRPADASGVGDMLEPTPAGPSVLRIIDSAEPKKQKPKTAKAPERVETKKQRQNRKKAEAAKAAREESEKERKALEEKQRRAARIAGGLAAKDGSQFQAANGSSSSWTQGAPNGASANKAEDAKVLYKPLDTFEEKPATSTAMPVAIKSDGSWMSSLPSEEEQLEMLKDEADEWSTVTVKASKKGKKALSVSSADEKPQAQPARQATQPAASTKNASRPTAGQNFGGSFSALTTNDDGAEDAEDAEEEWDV